jgi:hypothetical protein
MLTIIHPTLKTTSSQLILIRPLLEQDIDELVDGTVSAPNDDSYGNDDASSSDGSSDNDEVGDPNYEDDHTTVNDQDDYLNYESTMSDASCQNSPTASTSASTSSLALDDSSFHSPVLPIMQIAKLGAIFPRSALVANDGLMRKQPLPTTKPQVMTTTEEEQRCVSRQVLMFAPLTIKPGHQVPLPHLLARLSG